MIMSNVEEELKFFIIGSDGEFTLKQLVEDEKLNYRRYFICSDGSANRFRYNPDVEVNELLGFIRLLKKRHADFSTNREIYLEPGVAR